MKQRQPKTKTSFGGLAVLLLFAVFAVCILSVLLTGADVYKGLASRSAESYEQRTSAQYIATRVRQADRLGSISVRQFGEEDALVLAETIQDTVYETLIYYSGGMIRELFIQSGAGFAPEDGFEVMEAQGLEISADGEPARTLNIRIHLSDGSWEELTLYLRSGEVVPS